MKTNAVVLLLAFGGIMLSAAPEAQEKPQPSQPPAPRSHGDRGRGPHLWRAFSELSDEERAAMAKLQREDPEKFREAMLKKVEEIVRREKAERKIIQELAEKYKAAGSDGERSAVKRQLTELMRRRFNKRLAGNRRQLEAMKRQAVRLEKELDRREKNADKIVSMIVDSVLSGKKPFPPGRPGHHPGPPHDRLRNGPMQENK
ncbi:MAG: hypothetical protein IJU70_01305 [Lentisphaeria bacterium]|nr:hypothetical protein [Lentisphaeria bacterium]